MKIINDGLPDVIHEFLCQDFYDFKPSNKAISATTLLKPSQEIILTRRHNDEIEVLSSKRIWSLFGSATHAVLEKMEGEGVEKEERLNFTLNGILVSGKFDLIKNRQLYDYKTTSAWTLVMKDRLDEWQKQLSIYRWLYFKTREIKLDDTAHVIAILRDWSASMMHRIKNYPKMPIVELNIKLSSFGHVENFITAKLEELKSMEGLPDAELEPCSDKDRWYNAKKKQYMKCKDYCPCYKFCSQAGKDE